MIIPFENLCWLFKGGSESRGVCRLNLEEAAYLYSCIKSMNESVCVEIGRYYGGSTAILLATGAKVITIDNYCKDKTGSIEHEERLLKWFEDVGGTNDKIKIIIADSTTYDTSDLDIDVLFIDGDHSYEGVSKDFNNWFGCLKIGGSIFFHDCKTEGVEKVISENANLLNKINIASTLFHAEKRLLEAWETTR